MSGYSDEEISNGDRDGYQGGGSDGDDDDDDDDAIEKKQRRKLGCGFGKRVVLHPFTKAKNQIRRIRSKRERALFPSSSNASSRGKMIVRADSSHHSTRNGTGTGCRFCFLRPKVLETPNRSPISDPNDPNFTQAMLKTLIEKNDFYSKECNPHLD